MRVFRRASRATCRSREPSRSLLSDEISGRGEVAVQSRQSIASASAICCQIHRAAGFTAPDSSFRCASRREIVRQVAAA